MFNQIYSGKEGFSIQPWRTFWRQVQHRRKQSIHLGYRDTWRASLTYWRMSVQWELLKAPCDMTRWTIWELLIVLLATGKYPWFADKGRLDLFRTRLFSPPSLHQQPVLPAGVYYVLLTGRPRRSPNHSWATRMTTLFRWQPMLGLWTMMATINTRWDTWCDDLLTPLLFVWIAFCLNL